MLDKDYVVKRMNELLETIEACQKKGQEGKNNPAMMKRARECASEIGRLADEYLSRRRRSGESEK